KMDEAEMAARMRVERYKEALQLNEEQVEQMMRIFLAAEKEAMPLRKECAEIQSKLHGQMDRSIAEAEKNLSERQIAKLEKMRKEGKLVETPVCSAGTDGACCAAMSKTEKRDPAPAERAKPEVAKPSDTATPPSRPEKRR